MSCEDCDKIIGAENCHDCDRDLQISSKNHK
jgi:hypothetical protein